MDINDRRNVLPGVLTKCRNSGPYTDQNGTEQLSRVIFHTFSLIERALRPYSSELSESIRTPQRWQHSTGPKTEEGKAVSSQNARTHGCTSAQLTLPNEDPAEWEALKAAWLPDYSPECDTIRSADPKSARFNRCLSPTNFHTFAN